MKPLEEEPEQPWLKSWMLVRHVIALEHLYSFEQFCYIFNT
jgi:hypothetical protein